MAGARIPGALALVEFHGLRAGVRLPSRRSSVSETWSSDRAVIPLGLEMICPVHEGRAKFQAYAEMSLRQRLTIDHKDALSKLASQGSQPRMFFSAPEAPGEQAGAMRTDVTFTVTAFSAMSNGSLSTRRTWTSRGTRFPIRPSRGIRAGVSLEGCLSGARAGCPSGVASVRFLMGLFSFIHGLVGLGNQFAKGNFVLVIKPRHTDTDREVGAGFACFGLLEALFESTEKEFLGLV